MSAILGAALPATAATFGFNCITNNSLACATFAPQFSMNVTEGANAVTFTMFNGPAGFASSIEQIFFDDLTSLLTGTPALAPSGSGVDFSVDAAGANFPGGGTVSGWNTAFVKSVSADPPAPSNGINLGESLGVTYSLTSSQPSPYDDIVSALASGDLLIGIHVISLSCPAGATDCIDGQSESMILVPESRDAPGVPEPGTMVLLGGGLAAVGLLRRRARA